VRGDTPQQYWSCPEKILMEKNCNAIIKLGIMLAWFIIGTITEVNNQR